MVDSATQIGILLRILALILMVGFVLPKQYREYKIANGLKMFRGILFLLGILVTLASIVSLAFVLNYIMGNPLGFINGHVSVTNAGVHFLLSLILYIIYNFKGGEY